MTNEEKAHQLIKEMYPSKSMGDYGLKEQLCIELLKWKDEQIKSNLREAFGCMIFCQDQSLSNKEHQYIDLDIVQNIIESIFHIKLDEDGE